MDRPVDLEPALREAFAHAGPTLIGVKVDPNALVFPPEVNLEQAWSFGLARAKELFTSSEEQ